LIGGSEAGPGLARLGLVPLRRIKRLRRENTQEEIVEKG